MAGFLKAFTQIKTKISHESKNIQEFESQDLYSSFIVDYLLKSHSQKTFYRGLSIMKNILNKYPGDMA